MKCRSYSWEAAMIKNDKRREEAARAAAERKKQNEIKKETVLGKKRD